MRPGKSPLTAVQKPAARHRSTGKDKKTWLYWGAAAAAITATVATVFLLSRSNDDSAPAPMGSLEPLD